MDKICRTCGTRKPLEDFPKDPNKRDGHRHECKACTAAYMRRRYHLRKKMFEMLEKEKQKQKEQAS